MELGTMKWIASGVVGIVLATVAVEARYAKSPDVEQVAMRLDDKIKADRCYRWQRDLWALIDRYGPTCGPRADQCRRIRYNMKTEGCK